MHAVHMNADESVHFELEDYLMGLLLMCNELVRNATIIVVNLILLLEVEGLCCKWVIFLSCAQPSMKIS